MGFFLQRPWPPFVHRGTTFDLSHLNEHVKEATDSSKAKRTILVTFGDHCFTRPPNGEWDRAPRYPNCSRGVDGRFCTERHELSLQIMDQIDFASLKDVWNTKNDEHFVVIRGVDYQGTQIEYAVIFSLEKMKGVQTKGSGGRRIDLHMRVRTAHKRDDTIETFGSVRFPHLVKLVMEKKRPQRIYDHHRKRPSVPKKKQALSGLSGS
jgi:hypothetical protein